MDLLRCMFLSFLLRYINGSDFVISNDTTNWSTASERCTLAEPDLIFSSDKITVNISAAIIEDVWVGYYKAWTLFEYFGCAVKDSTKTPIDTYSKDNPGRCFSACDGQGIVGIFQNECFCFGEHEIKHNASTILSSCDLPCVKQGGKSSGIVCGGSTGENTYMSLYRSIGTDIISMNMGNTNQVCLGYLDGLFIWRECSRYQEFICETDESVRTYKVGILIYKRWLDSTITCFANNSRPSTYNYTKNVFTTVASPELWTGIVRSEVVYKSKDSSNLKQANGYGYIDKYSYQLKFAGDINNERLCVNVTSGTQITSLPVSTVPSSSNNKTESLVQDTTQATITKHSSVPPTTTVRNNDTNSTPELKSEGYSAVGAAVGATLVIVAVVVIGIFTALFLRKRDVKLPCFKKETNTSNSSNNSRDNAVYVNSRSVEIQHSACNTSEHVYANTDVRQTTDNEEVNRVVNNDMDTEHGYMELGGLEERQYDSIEPGNENCHPNAFNRH